MSHPLARRLILGIAFSALGTGLTMPFLYVYLAQVRGFPGPVVGLVFAWMGLLSFIAAPLGGSLIDRYGPRVVVVVGLVVEAVGVFALAYVQTVPQGFAVATGTATADAETAVPMPPGMSAAAPVVAALCAAAATVTQRAVVSAVLAATGVGAIPAYRDVLGSALAGRR